MNFRLGKGIPHPWWHNWIYTEWLGDFQVGITSFDMDILYRCSRCKKNYRIRTRPEQYEEELINYEPN